MNRFEDDFVYEQESAEVGDGAPKKRFGGDIIARVICLLVAFLIWLYVMSAESPDHEEMYRSLPVELENAAVLKNEYNMSVISGTGNLADVTIKGKKSDLGRYGKKDIKVYVDLSQIKDTGRHVLDIIVEAPTGLVVSDVSPSSIQVYVDNDTAKTVKVVAKAKSYTLDASCYFGEIVPDVTEVIVRGPAETLDRIDHALVEFDLGTVSETIVSRGELKLVDVNGEIINDPYVKMNNTSVQVTIPVYTTKEIPLTVDYLHGYFNDKNVKVEITPATVTLKGDPKVLESIDSISVVTLDEKKIRGATQQMVNVTVPVGTTLENSPSSVSVKITHIGTATRAIAINAFDVINPNGVEYRITDALNIIFRAPESLLPVITSQHISVTVDLSYVGTNTGIMSIPAIVKIDDSVSDRVYEIGDYRVQVEILED